MASQTEVGVPESRAASERAVPYVLEDQVGHLLRRAYQRATAIFAEIMTEFQLTPTQFAALAKILDEGTVSQNELGRMTAMDPSTMQGVMLRLCERTLVKRRPDPNDRRRMLLSLTESGYALILRAVTVGDRVTAETLAPLTPAQRRDFLKLLRLLT